MAQVLVVNGDNALRSLWCDLFGERGHAAEAADGDLDPNAFETPPELIVVDLDSLTSMGQGLYIIERSRAILPDIPIIAVSEWSQLALRDEAHSLGANVCVRKPVNYAVFLKLVDAMMNQHAHYEVG